MSDGPPPFQPDRTFQSAIADAQRDYARLLHAHSPSWEINLYGAVVYRCSCDDKARNALALDAHILVAVKNARGPVRRAK